MKDMTVMVVYENQKTRKMIQDALKFYVSGKAVAFSSVAAAWRYLSTQEVGAIICDAWISEMTVPEFISMVRSQYPQIIIIIMATDSRKKSAALAAGADFFLQKPFSMKELVEMLARNTELKAS